MCCNNGRARTPRHAPAARLLASNNLEGMQLHVNEIPSCFTCLCWACAGRTRTGTGAGTGYGTGVSAAVFVVLTLAVLTALTLGCTSCTKRDDGIKFDG